MPILLKRPPPGYLDALKALHAPSDRSRDNWYVLTRDEQIEAVRKLAAQGLGDYEIAAATSLSVETVRQTLGERRT